MGLITRPYNYVAGQTIRAAEVNSNENTLYDAVNGNLEDINLKSDSLTERVLTDSVNPLARDADKYQNFVVEGLEASDVSDTTAAVLVSAGKAYTIYSGKMYRAVISSETYGLGTVVAGTYYLYIDYTGGLSHGTALNPGDGKQVIARLDVSTGPYSITVTDLRKMRLYDITSHYLHGCILEYLSTSTFKVTSGVVEIDGALYKNTSDADSIDITESANYFEGVPVVAGQWCYVYLTPYGTSGGFSVKLSTAAPDLSDPYGNTSGVKIYRKPASSVYRCIGAVYREDDGSLRKFYQQDSHIQYDSFIDLSSGSAVNANIPEISMKGYFELFAAADGSNEAISKIRPSGSSCNFFQLDTGTVQIMVAYTICCTNASQQVECVLTTAGSSTATCKTAGFWLNIR